MLEDERDEMLEVEGEDILVEDSPLNNAFYKYAAVVSINFNKSSPIECL